MPDPDRVARLPQARLYLCTPDRPDLADFLDAVLAGGVDVVQLRQKGLDARQELELCERVGDAAARHDALWAVNDRADVAYCAHPDALHLGQDDLPVPAARYLLGDGVLVGPVDARPGPGPGRGDRAGRRLRLRRAGAARAEPPAPARRRARPGARDGARCDPPRPWFADGGITGPEHPGGGPAGRRPPGRRRAGAHRGRRPGVPPPPTSSAACSPPGEAGLPRGARRLRRRHAAARAGPAHPGLRPAAAGCCSPCCRSWRCSSSGTCWRSGPGTGRTTRGRPRGVVLGDLPLEELLFFLVVPVCAVLTLEAVRAVKGWPVGDEWRATPPPPLLGVLLTVAAGPVGAAHPAAHPAGVLDRVRDHRLLPAGHQRRPHRPAHRHVRRRRDPRRRDAAAARRRPASCTRRSRTCCSASRWWCRPSPGGSGRGAARASGRLQNRLATAKPRRRPARPERAG